MLDLLITDADVIDGRGGPRRRADVAVHEGRIVEIGRIGQRARRVIDAEGRVVAPGFVDVHTHYDAQVFWDPLLTPSSLYGVTTVMAGNCGFTIAPLASDQADYLMRMLARVEGMPLDSLAVGVPWSWTTTAEYLDLVDDAGLALNAGFMVGHSALRRVVMGDAGTERAATDGELSAMQAMLRLGLQAGGIGFSTSWGAAHQDGDGVPVPSRHATPDEIIALAAVCREFPGTSLEFLPPRPDRFDRELVDLMIGMSVAAQRPVNWNVMRVDAVTLDDQMAILEIGSRAEREGGRVVALTMPVPSLGRFSFHTAFVLDGLPGWKDTMTLPIAERQRALRDPSIRRQLEAAADVPTFAGDLTEWASKVITQTFAPELARYQRRLVGEIASEEGKSPFDALLDIVCADDLRTTFSRFIPPDTTADWEARTKVWRDGRAIIGASDAGAHLDFTTNVHYPAWVVAEAVRNHRTLSLEEAVHLMTDVPARLYGLTDRGRVEVGGIADLVVLDADAYAPGAIETRFDLPAGAPRLFSEPTGVGAVIVNGRPVLIDGVPTGTSPGRVLRSGRDTTTPVLT